MNKQTIVFGIIILALVWVLRPHTGLAQSVSANPLQGPAFNGVIPFGTAAGNFGMFDQNSGKVYIYDNNLAECIFIGEVQELGKPIKKAEKE